MDCGWSRSWIGDGKLAQNGHNQGEPVLGHLLAWVEMELTVWRLRLREQAAEPGSNEVPDEVGGVSPIG